MRKLEYRIWQEMNLICLQILSQPSNLRGSGSIFWHNNMELRSNYTPKLTEDAVYIRGIRSAHDNVTVAYGLKSRKEAAEYKKKVESLLDAYNKHLMEHPNTQPSAVKDNLISEIEAGKLRYRFDRVGKVVVATPLSIPPHARQSNTSFIHEGFTIRIVDCAISVIYDAVLHIGVDGQHVNQATRLFDSEEAAEEWIHRAAATIAAYNCKIEPIMPDVTTSGTVAE